jgi:hypothetical protein
MPKEPPAHPPFSSLPLRKGDPPHSAWGLWGEDDNLGTLNYLSEENTKQAATEIKEGIRIGLNWAFGEPTVPCFGRQEFEHKVIPLWRLAEGRKSTRRHGS